MSGLKLCCAWKHMTNTIQAPVSILPLVYIFQNKNPNNWHLMKIILDLLNTVFLILNEFYSWKKNQTDPRKNITRKYLSSQSNFINSISFCRHYIWLEGNILKLSHYYHKQICYNHIIIGSTLNYVHKVIMTCSEYSIF